MNDIKKKVILIVEDEIPLQSAIKLKLEKECFEATTARSVGEAIGHLESAENIDAVWLDHYLLGGEDGFDFLMKLKSEESKWKNIPVFLVSNTASDEKVQNYISLGVERYYAKSNSRLCDIIEDIKTHLSVE